MLIFPSWHNYKFRNQLLEITTVKLNKCPNVQKGFNNKMGAHGDNQVGMCVEKQL